jgi:hypothetical protein
MSDPTTSRLGIPYPVSSDSVSSGPAEMEAIAAVVDADWGLEYGDFLNPGFAYQTALGSVNASGPTINGSTGALTFSLAADEAWIENSSGVLTRCSLPTGSHALTPGTLPSSGDYLCVGLYAEPNAWDAAATLALAVGTAESSQALALANPPSAPSNSVLVEYVVILNTSGTYSISTTADMRTPVAHNVRGQSYVTTPAAGLTNVGLSSIAVATGEPCQVSFVMEEAGMVFVTGICMVKLTAFTSGGDPVAGLLLDGVLIPSVTGNASGGQGMFDTGFTGGPPSWYVYIAGASSNGVYCILDNDTSSVPGFTGTGFCGTPTGIYVPAGAHTIAWGYCIYAATGTYTVETQFLAVDQP